jgi:hypothetical protein
MLQSRVIRLLISRHGSCLCTQPPKNRTVTVKTRLNSGTERPPRATRPYGSQPKPPPLLWLVTLRFKFRFKLPESSTCSAEACAVKIWNKPDSPAELGVKIAVRAFRKPVLALLNLDAGDRLGTSFLSCFAAIRTCDPELLVPAHRGLSCCDLGMRIGIFELELVSSDGSGCQSGTKGSLGEGL